MIQDVTIVGAGPVGMTAAMVLARAGVSVRLLEANPGLSRESDASVFHAPTLELLDDFNISEKLIPLGTRADRIQFRDYHAGTFAELDYAVIKDAAKYPFRLHIEQWEMTRLAYAYLWDTGNVRIDLGTRVAAIEPGTESTDVRCADGTSFRTRWLFGTDGGRSTIRPGIGVEMEGNTYAVRNMTVKTSTDLSAVMDDTAPVMYVAGGPADISPYGVAVLHHPDHWRISCRMPEEKNDDAILPPEELQRFLRGAVSDRIDEYSIDRHFSYSSHRVVATDFRKGRVLLAGDAAHLNSPAGGLGMNSGIHDAYTMANALVRCMDDADPEGSEVAHVALERHREAVEIIGPRSENNFNEEFDPNVRAGLPERMNALLADRERTRRYLIERSMIDHAPRPQQLMAR